MWVAWESQKFDGRTAWWEILQSYLLFLLYQLKCFAFRGVKLELDKEGFLTAFVDQG